MGVLELGVPGQIMPPADAAVRFAKRSEDEGFDAVWWPDHLMGWHPDSMWRPDLTPLAEAQPRLTLRLNGVAALTVDTARAGLAALARSTITVDTDGAAEITLDRLPSSTTVRIDGARTDRTVSVPPGRHRITLAPGVAHRKP